MNRFFSFSKQRTNTVKKTIPVVKRTLVQRPVVRRAIVRRPVNSFQKNLIERLNNPASCGCGK
jgi:hypothetical protein